MSCTTTVLEQVLTQPFLVVLRLRVKLRLQAAPAITVTLGLLVAPEIVPLIKRIVYMGGAFEVRGNTTPAAEMNIWYDAEAARAVIREPIEQVFIPIDVTNTVPLTKAIFDKVTANPDHTLGYMDVQKPVANYLQKHKVVLRFDNERFYKLYIDLLTRPVPVRVRTEK